METVEMTTTVLNDLVKINNDRVAGYQKAIDELKDSDYDLRTLFNEMIRQSEDYKLQLASEISALNEEIEEGTTNLGKVYRLWMDLKAVFTGHNRKAVLSNCEMGEDAAQKAYGAALQDRDLPNHVWMLISEQKQKLKEAHDKIKALRDVAP